jgi:ketosteroid isomerase-like protein
MNDAAVEIARRLNAAILARDLEGALALYHEDALVWRNLDGRSLGRKQTRKVLEFLFTKVGELRYDDVRVHATPRGFVQQHTLRGRAPSGEPIVAHACLVATVEAGRILRLDEYLDSAAMAPLMR